MATDGPPTADPQAGDAQVDRALADDGRVGRDRGASAIEMVIIFPVTLFIVFAIVQFGVWYHASAIARAAAQQGARAGSVDGARPGDDVRAAEGILDADAHGLLADPQVTRHAPPGSVEVTVSGRALSIVPLVGLTVHQSATAPVEAYREPAGG